MIRVSLVHASFGRPTLALNAEKEWFEKSDRPHEIEYVLALDDNDPKLAEYLKQSNQFFERVIISIGDSRTGIQAMNRGVKSISKTSELVMVVADDQGCPEHWDTELFKLLEGIDNFTEPRYLYVSDGMTPMEEDGGPKFGYMNRAFYERLGFLQHPDYVSMYADNDLFECAKILGMIRAPHLVFEHRHHSRGLTPWDNTYWRTNNLQALEQGQKVFEERKKRHFDL